MNKKPFWQRRTVISTTRNISVVVWSPTEGEHGLMPASIVLSEGKNIGSSENPKWENKDIRLTLDKLPRILMDLQLAYGKAVALETGELESPEGPSESSQKPTLAGLIFQIVSEEREISVGTLSERVTATPNAIKAAVEQLQQKGFITVKTKGLEPYLELTK